MTDLPPTAPVFHDPLAGDEADPLYEVAAALASQPDDASPAATPAGTLAERLARPIANPEEPADWGILAKFDADVAHIGTHTEALIEQGHRELRDEIWPRVIGAAA